MAPVHERFWGIPTSTLDWCERNYEVSPFIAEFSTLQADGESLIPQVDSAEWKANLMYRYYYLPNIKACPLSTQNIRMFNVPRNTISNLGMIIPPIFGIYEIVKLKLERKFILTHIFLIVVGIGSWAFHMTLLWPMQLADELPMVWGNTILIYQLWEIRKSAKRQMNWSIIILCFTYCFFFTALYLIYKNPLIHHGMYAILVLVVLWLDLRLVNLNQCRTCTRLLSTGIFMYVFGFGLWNIDNQMCRQITDVRALMPRTLKPFTQLHAWWHILAGYATHLHILFGIHARGHFVKPKVAVELKCYGIGVARADPIYPVTDKTQ